MEGYPGDDQITPALGYTIDLSGAVAVWMPEFDMGNPQHIATLAHELLHAVHIRLYHKCNVEYWLGSAESAPYYLEFLMLGFLEQIKAKCS